MDLNLDLFRGPDRVDWGMSLLVNWAIWKRVLAGAALLLEQVAECHSLRGWLAHLFRLGIESL